MTEGRLRRHRTSPQEIEDLFGLAARSLTDAQVEGVSLDGRFASAYNAALSLATIPLCVAGYRSKGVGHHATVFAALPELLGPDVQKLATYLDVCRIRRNETEYRRAGMTTDSALADLVTAVTDLRQRVEAWLSVRNGEERGTGWAE